MVLKIRLLEWHPKESRCSMIGPAWLSSSGMHIMTKLQCRLTARNRKKKRMKKTVSRWCLCCTTKRTPLYIVSYLPWIGKMMYALSNIFTPFHHLLNFVNNEFCSSWHEILWIIVAFFVNIKNYNSKEIQNVLDVVCWLHYSICSCFLV